MSLFADSMVFISINKNNLVLLLLAQERTTFAFFELSGRIEIVVLARLQQLNAVQM